MASQHIFSYTLQQLDTNGNVKARSSQSVTQNSPTAGQLIEGSAPDTGAHSITLPITQPRQIVFYNTHATAKFTIIWTPFGGASATINLIGPGGVLALFDPTAATTGNGVSALSVTSDTSGGTYELFIGG